MGDNCAFDTDVPPVSSLDVKSTYETIQHQTSYSTNGKDSRLPLDRLFSVQGKTAICTGVTGGIGFELCVSLAEAGADIVSIQLPNDPAGASLEKSVRELGRSFMRFECDVSNSRLLRETFSDIWAAEVVPDILLNAAGINRRGPMEDFTDEDLDKVSVALSRISTSEKDVWA